MLCKIKTSKKIRIFKTILTDFSRKEKAITRYTRIYIKQNGRDKIKQAKSFIFIMVPQQKQQKCSNEQRGKNSNNNNTDDSNKTNKNNNEIMIIAITVVQ